MNINESLEVILNEVKEVGNWTLPIPSKYDREIIKCIQFYNSQNLENRQKIRKEINVSVARLLLFFSERMATLSLRTKNQSMFDIGLFGLSITLGKIDIREITLIFSLYFDVFKRCSVSFNKILEQKDEFSEHLSSFLNRKNEDKQIESMGYIVEVNEMKELAYKRNW